MRLLTFYIISSAVILFLNCSTAKKGVKGTSSGQVIWNIDNLTSIGGNKTTVLGSPKVIDTPGGKAVEFDDVKDALISVLAHRIELKPSAKYNETTIEFLEEEITEKFGAASGEYR